jgi:hypothetical protein
MFTEAEANFKKRPDFAIILPYHRDYVYVRETLEFLAKKEIISTFYAHSGQPTCFIEIGEGEKAQRGVISCVSRKDPPRRRLKRAKDDDVRPPESNPWKAKSRRLEDVDYDLRVQFDTKSFFVLSTIDYPAAQPKHRLLTADGQIVCPSRLDLVTTSSSSSSRTITFARNQVCRFQRARLSTPQRFKGIVTEAARAHKLARGSIQPSFKPVSSPLFTTETQDLFKTLDSRGQNARWQPDTAPCPTWLLLECPRLLEYIRYLTTEHKADNITFVGIVNRDENQANRKERMQQLFIYTAAALHEAATKGDAT